jgi:hypothetical protein
VQLFVRPLRPRQCCGSVSAHCDVAAGVGVWCSSFLFSFRIHNLVVLYSRRLIKLNQEVKKKKHIYPRLDATVSSPRITLLPMLVDAAVTAVSTHRGDLGTFSGYGMADLVVIGPLADSDWSALEVCGGCFVPSLRK